MSLSKSGLKSVQSEVFGQKDPMISNFSFSLAFLSPNETQLMAYFDLTESGLLFSTNSRGSTGDYWRLVIGNSCDPHPYCLL